MCKFSEQDQALQNNPAGSLSLEGLCHWTRCQDLGTCVRELLTASGLHVYVGARRVGMEGCTAGLSGAAERS